MNLTSARTARTRWATTAMAWLPRGRTLPYASWQVRHRAVIWLLVAHAAVLATVSALIGRSLGETLVNAGVPALGAYAASRPALSRGVRSALAAVSLMLTSGVVVHLMNGSIEGHFHFFAMIPVVALYEDWVPFGLAVLVVLLHHGVMGTLQPSAVYDHPDAIAHPWRWALIHAGFFAAACVGSVINWKLHENARDAESQLTESMRHQAHHDVLTGLPNRASLLSHAYGLLSDTASRDQQHLSVLLIDLDRFKEINDVLGHACGDELLAQLGPMLSTLVRDGDVMARLGGDEFAAVLANTNEAEAVVVAQRLLGMLSSPVTIGGVPLTVDASIGIATCGPSDESGDRDIDALLRRADIAMYTAKRARSGFAVFAADQDTATLERLTMITDLRRAIDNGEIVLHFQPKVDLATRVVAGVEALARWQHPSRGLVPPSEFIAAAESTGLILPLTMHVLDRALAQIAAWRAAGHGDIPVAVNLSPRCLADPALPTRIDGLLAEHGIRANLLELEITENSMASDPDTALATLNRLHEFGIRISIDDFGTGYSSMSYLKRLPVSELKVDRSFVMGMLEHAGDAVLVRSVVDLGHNLGLVVVAEGVEDQATLDALAALGCDIAQGFYLARPMPADSLTHWLEEHLTAVPA